MSPHPSSRPPVPSPLRFQTRRLVLRPLMAGDFPAWREVRAANEAWLTPWEPRRPPSQFDPAISQPAFESRCQAREREATAGLSYGFGLYLDHVLTGEVNLNSILRGATQAATIGYWVDHRRAGQGYVAEGVVAVIAFAFNILQLHRIEICIVPRNHNSRRVVEKLGLVDEGIARGLVEINGVWEDHIRYAILAEEWQARRDELTAAWLRSPATP